MKESKNSQTKHTKNQSFMKEKSNNKWKSYNIKKKKIIS